MTMFNVKSRRTAERIAAVFRANGSPEGAEKYLAKYEIRRAIEQAAVEASNSQVRR